MKNEEERIEAEVQKRVAALMAAQQEQFAAMMEMTMKNAVGALDGTNKQLKKEQEKLEKRFDVANELITKAEREGEQMAYDSYQKHSLQYREEAQITLLRNLARWHIEVGKSTRDIAVWLDVPQKFVEDIRRIVRSIAEYRELKRKPLEGNPRIQILGSGRSGTIHFESRETSFDLWWEFGYSAFMVVDVPSPEDWTARTNLPVSRREEILNFIGEEIVLKEVPYDGYYLVGENVVTIYREEKTDSQAPPHTLFSKK